MKSAMLAELELEVLVLTMIVLKPKERHWSKLPSKALRSRAASANAFGAYSVCPKAPYGTATTLLLRAAKTRPAGSEVVTSTYSKPPRALFVRHCQAKKSATFPPPTNARLSSKSLTVRPPWGPAETNEPLLLRTS